MNLHCYDSPVNPILTSTLTSWEGVQLIFPEAVVVVLSCEVWSCDVRGGDSGRERGGRVHTLAQGRRGYTWVRVSVIWLKPGQSGVKDVTM